MPNSSQPKDSKTPWKYNEQRYAKLVNLTGDLKTYGWIVLTLAIIIGLGLVITGFNRISFVDKVLAFSFGFIFLLVGAIVKVVWYTVSEVIKLLIDMANNVDEIRLK